MYIKTDSRYLTFVNASTVVFWAYFLTTALYMRQTFPKTFMESLTDVQKAALKSSSKTRGDFVTTTMLTISLLIIFIMYITSNYIYDRTKEDKNDYY